MRITVVVDNHCSKSGLYAEWGYSAYLETESGNLLLDTAGPMNVLEHNLKFLKLDTAAIDAVILSHGHYDHIGGIESVLKLSPEAKIYAGSGVYSPRRGDADKKRENGGIPASLQSEVATFDDTFEALPSVIAFRVPAEKRNSRFVCQKNLWKVCDGNTIVADPFEDDVSLVVKGRFGWSLLLGCAHAGLPNILKYAEEKFGIDEWYCVIGGTHLCSVGCEDYENWMQELSAHKVKMWRPAHCTGFKAAAALARTFEDVDWAGAGFTAEL